MLAKISIPYLWIQDVIMKKFEYYQIHNPNDEFKSSKNDPKEVNDIHM